ncbi:MFS transporter [Microbispora rosea subsp. aerata]|nr:MFS transporter [Microbispora rosea]GGO12892.1 MFS transporter [Microbispora rosea subsp. aerata]GIH54156.1 MFS transporter [Microbispora rosea subsp. aerata]GLJ85130.1 MFS transporter [Microbispora rosea subsp. aerata]
MSALRRGLWAPVALSYAAFILVGLSSGVGGVLLPAQIDDYGLDKATIGTQFFTFSAGFMLAGATTGPLIHRLGIRTSLAVGGGAFVLAGLFTAVRPPFLAFLAAQIVAGYGTGVFESVLNAYLADLPGATTLLNRLHAFFGVGALLGPLLATGILSVLPWTAVWLVLALLALPLLIGFRLTLPAREAPPPTPAGEHADAPAGGLLATASRQPAVVLGAIFLAVYVGLEISVGNWGFSFLVDEHGQSDLLAGYTVSGYWLGLTLGRFLISPIATRLGMTATGMTFLCLAGVTLSTALAWLVPGAAMASVSFVLLGFWLGPVFPTTMAVAPRLTVPRLVPTAIGLINGVSVVGGAVFPWLAGAIAQGVGSWTLPPFALALALLQLVVWWLLTTRMTPAPAAGGAPVRDKGAI